jgi:hypothetical protein
VPDYDPAGSPVTGADTDKRLSVTCDGEPYLTSWDFIGLKESNTDTAVLDGVDVKGRTPIGIPARSFLHVNMIAAMERATHGSEKPL